MMSLAVQGSSYDQLSTLTVLSFSVGVITLCGFGLRMGILTAGKRTNPWKERGKGVVQILASAAFLILFLAPLAWWLLPPDSPVGSFLVFLAAGLVVACLVTDRFVKLVTNFDSRGSAEISLKLLMLRASSAHLKHFRSTLQLFTIWLMPDGFRDVRPLKLLRLPFRNGFKAFGAFYCATLLMAVVMLVTQVGTGQSTDNQVLRTWSVFWVLMFAVSLTPCTALAWLVLKYLADMGAIQCRVKLSTSLSIMANWVSIGGILGLLTGALSFLPLRFVARDGFKDQEPIPLSLLADLSLAGAVAGFVAAHFAVLFATTAQMRNRLVGVVLPIFTMSALAFLCSWAGINPAANSRYSLTLLRESTVVPSDASALENLGIVDWKVLLVLGAESMSGVFPAAGTFALIVTVIAIVVGLLMLIVTFRSSQLRLQWQAERPSQLPGPVSIDSKSEASSARSLTRSTTD
ncbi:hypothetical protein AAIH32_12215 [Pseudarthrobacter oxydans]|uniref:hypothetical protein n=1 Tax=Pseudarthrobacter oxydans TaxID=1671 RepID=UPI003D2D9E7B